MSIYASFEDMPGAGDFDLGAAPWLRIGIGRDTALLRADFVTLLRDQLTDWLYMAAETTARRAVRPQDATGPSGA